MEAIIMKISRKIIIKDKYIHKSKKKIIKIVEHIQATLRIIKK